MSREYHVSVNGVVWHVRAASPHTAAKKALSAHYHSFEVSKDARKHRQKSVHEITIRFEEASV